MKIFHGRQAGAPTEQRSATFSGTVYADPVMATTDNVTINNVFFAAGARTYWHAHEYGQILQVTAGSGLVCVEGGMPQVIRTGDVVWIPADERHWHGASQTTCMAHVATSLGKTSWHEEVTNEHYTLAAIA